MGGRTAGGASGGIPTAGFDTWVWERYRVWVQQPSGFNYAYNIEKTRNIGYIGGTQWPGGMGCSCGFGQQNYFQKPSEIKNGQHGLYGAWIPGSQGQRSMHKELASTFGTSFEIKAATGGAAISGNFESKSTTKTVDKVVEIFDTLSMGEARWAGPVYRYDQDTTGKIFYWSCEWGPGFTGGACYDSGA